MFQGLKFEVIPSTFEETLDKSAFSTPAEYVLETAQQKTLQVAHLLKQESVSHLLLVLFVAFCTKQSVNSQIL